MLTTSKLNSQHLGSQTRHSSLSKEEILANSFPLFRRRGVSVFGRGVVIFAFLLSFNFAHAYTFTKSFGLGATGEEVRQLQIFLNKDQSTQIAASGAGSPGNETNTFGALTKSALIRFQQKNGLPAFGFFGPVTMEKVNQLVSATVSSITSAVGTTVAAGAISSGGAAVTCPFPGCFGGVAVSQMLCPCSGNFLVFFSPLYLYPSSGPISGALVFQPGTMAFPNFNILPSEGVIGTYAPGVQACIMPGPTGCPGPIMPSLGLIMPFTGSSLPGGGLTR